MKKAAMKKKADTMRVLLSGCRGINSEPEYTHILGEISVLHTITGNKPGQRIGLLQILFMTRILDSSLAAFVRYHGYTITDKDRHLKGYLRALGTQSPAGLSKLNYGKYITSIVHKRNRYMHKAGTYPTTPTEVEDIVEEVRECIERIVNL